MQPIDRSEIVRLMSIDTDDAHQGWRVVFEYPSTRSTDRGYRAAHERARRIRYGKHKELAGLGVWNARAGRLNKSTVAIWLRYEGADGTRWEK